MADESRGYYGVQFHPEVTHTRKGREILTRFVHEICGCKGDWQMPDYVSEAVGQDQGAGGSDEVILGLSGGVDSSVAAALITRRSASSSPACSSITACCGWTRASR
jgi:GMP synthase (glutamine-hydrolysing)